MTTRLPHWRDPRAGSPPSPRGQSFDGSSCAHMACAHETESVFCVHFYNAARDVETFSRHFLVNTHMGIRFLIRLGFSAFVWHPRTRRPQALSFSRVLSLRYIIMYVRGDVGSHTYRNNIISSAFLWRNQF